MHFAVTVYLHMRVDTEARARLVRYGHGCFVIGLWWMRRSIEPGRD